MALKTQSKRKPQPTDDVPMESAEARAVEPTPEPAPRGAPRVKRDSEAVMLLVAGLAFAAVGAGLSFGSRFSWKLLQIQSGLDSLGIHGGTLLMGGLALAALSLLRRSLSALGSKPEDLRDDALLLEQVATDMVQMRNALTHVQRVSSDLHEELRSVRGDVQAQAAAVAAASAASAASAAASAPSSSEPGREDAIYRLAASLDQLGARIEQRLKAQYAAVQESLEEVSSTLVISCKTLQETVRRAAVERDEHGSTEGMAGPAAEGADAGAGSLGVLDRLDDYGAPPTVGAAAGANDVASAEAAKAAAALPRGRPNAKNGSWEEELQMIESAMPMDQETRSKIEARLRSALESMRRSGA